MFSAVLDSILKARERNASWLARKIDAAPSSVLRWVAGQTMPEPRTLASIREALAADGVPSSDLDALNAAYLGLDMVSDAP